MKRISIIAYLLIITCVKLLAQGQQFAPPKLNTIIQPSPQVAELQKYIDYPVSHTTGIPDISIPILEIKSGTLKLPITISYNHSGLNVNDENGDLGLGWVLNAGTSLSRKIVNKPDERCKYPVYRDPYTLNLFYYNDFEYIANQNNQTSGLDGEDAEYDVFYYNVGTSQGKILFVASDDLGTGKRKPVTIPYEPIVISTNKGDFSNIYTQIEYIEIINNDGNIYRFGKSQTDGTMAVESTILDNGPYYTTWFLREIYSPDKTHFIKFNYEFVSRNRISHYSESYEYLDKTMVINQSDEVIQNWWNQQDCSFEIHQSDEHNTSYASQRISDISFDNGSIKFFYNENGLYSVVEKDNDDNIIKTIDFQLNKFNGSDYYNKLSTIRFSESNPSTYNAINLDYYEPLNSELTNVNLKTTRGVDYWGYFNGKTNNLNLIPPLKLEDTYKQPLPFYISTNNREADEKYSKLLMLKKINYSTGGFTEFYYESNKANSKPTGGLRIESISQSTSPNTTTIIKKYKYDDEKSILTQNPYNIHSFMSVSEKNYGEIDAKRRLRSISSTMNDGGDINSGCSVFYPKVTEYFSNLIGDTITKSVYEYEPPKDIRKDNYLTATIYPIMTGGGLAMSDSSLIGASSYRAHYTDWKSNHLKIKTDYIMQQNKLTPIRKEELFYTIRNDSTIKCIKTMIKQTGLSPNYISLWGIFYPNHNYYNLSYFTVGNYPLFDVTEYQNSFGVVYNVVPYDYSAGVKHLSQKKTTTYLSTGNVVEIENYQYGDNHNEPLSVSYLKSNGDTHRIKYRYPQDFITSQPYTYMVNNLHIISPVVEQLNYKVKPDNTETFVSSTKTNYNFWNGTDWSSTTTNQVFPKTIETKTGNINATPITWVQFNKYDIYGNLLEQQKPLDVKESYLWSYKYQYPIAKIMNASYAQVSTALAGITAEQLANSTAPDMVKVNALRQHPSLSNSLITTYTYKPLVGMTSMTDPRGITTIFNYDLSNRLGETRDRAGNILAKYQYAYATQTNTSSSMPELPDFSAIVNCNLSVKTGVNESISVTASNGSGSFVYGWKITDANSVTLINIEDTNLSSYAYTYPSDGNYTVFCTIKDIVSGKVQVLTKSVISSSITASMSFYTSNLVNTSNLAMVAASSNSNSFTFSYEVKNSSGVIIQSNYNSTSSSYPFTLTTPGNYTVYCTIKDNVTASTKTISKQLYICNANLSVNITGTTTYAKGSNGSLLANITGGSGSFSYSWTKSNNYISLNTSSMPPVSFTCGNTSGSTVLTFTITDILTGKSITATKTVTVQ